jgi:arylsulfatase A-like enzyme
VHSPGGQPFFVEWTLSGAGSRLMERGNPETLHLRENVPAGSERQARDELTLFLARANTWDREIGVVLGALDLPDVGENTIVLFTSYHGEQFGSHGEWGDDSVFEESIRIPLAIRYPGAIQPGTRSEILVSQVDLVPTLLAWCGVPVPETVQGRDLSLMMTGKVADRPDSIYAQGRRGQKDEWRMVVQGYDKLVADLEGNVTHLYNLADDPLELTNLANASAQQLKRDALLALMRVWMRKLGDGVDASGLKKR